MHLHNGLKNKFIYISDLTPEEQQLLADIRRRKEELLREIQVSCFSIFFIKEPLYQIFLYQLQ